MGFGEDFKLFCDNLTVNNRSDISDRYETITQRLNTDFWLSNSKTNHSLAKNKSALDRAFLRCTSTNSQIMR
jgi:Second Messenger Oligonucleotide or Dinucleotide Synthetase domain